MADAEESGQPRRSVRRMTRVRRKSDKRRHGFVERTFQTRNCRSDRGPTAGWRILRGAAGIANVRVVRAAGRTVNRTQRHDLVGDCRQPGQVLTDLYARHVGFDRLKLAANFSRGFHLQVVHVLVRRRAAHVDHDDRLVRSAQARLRLGRQQLRQGQSAHRQRTDLQKLPPRHTVAQSILSSGNGQHGGFSAGGGRSGGIMRRAIGGKFGHPPTPPLYRQMLMPAKRQLWTPITKLGKRSGRLMYGFKR